MKPKIKVLLLDIDGVIIKENRFSERYSRDFGVPVEKILKYIHNEHQKCLVGESETEIELLKYLNDWNWTKSVDELLVYWYDPETEVDELVLVEVEKLRQKGIKICLATNQTKSRMQHLGKNVPIFKKFAKVYVSHRLGAKKPQREFFQKILEDLKPIKPEEILFFDNNADKLSGAKDLGFNVEVFTGINNFKSCLGKMVIKSGNMS